MRSLTHTRAYEQKNACYQKLRASRIKYANDTLNLSQICCDVTLPIQVEHKANALTI